MYKTEETGSQKGCSVLVQTAYFEAASKFLLKKKYDVGREAQVSGTQVDTCLLKHLFIL